MFNLIENKYFIIHGVAFSFPEIEQSPVFNGFEISTTTNNKRGAVLSLFNGDHPIKTSDGIASIYYPIPIPKGAMVAYSNNNNELALDICYHILKYDEEINDYVRVWASGWHVCNINGGVYVFDISKFNDGTYYIASGLASSGTESLIINRGLEDIYAGRKTRSIGGGQLVLSYDDIKSANITIA